MSRKMLLRSPGFDGCAGRGFGICVVFFCACFSVGFWTNRVSILEDGIDFFDGVVFSFSGQVFTCIELSWIVAISRDKDLM